jgi:hypothetical protein
MGRGTRLDHGAHVRAEIARVQLLHDARRPRRERLLRCRARRRRRAAAGEIYYGRLAIAWNVLVLDATVVGSSAESVRAAATTATAANAAAAAVRCGSAGETRRGGGGVTFRFKLVVWCRADLACWPDG